MPTSMGCTASDNFPHCAAERVAMNPPELERTERENPKSLTYWLPLNKFQRAVRARCFFLI